MKILLLLALLQAPPEPAAPAIEPWSGSFAEGLAEVKRLSESGEIAEALVLTERLLAPTPSAKWREEATANPGWKRTVVEAAGPILGAFGVASLSDAERATIHHARGVLLSQSTDGARLAAVEAFERARSLAGPGELRLDATYDAGWSWLAEGEAHRAKIPEISGAAPPPAAPAGAEPPAPDLLVLAQNAYLQARERFVDRLKLESSDADTRANLELAQRRLRELSEIEKKREEEKKKQEEEQKDQQKNEEDPNKDDPKKDEEKKDPQEKPDEQPKPDEKKPDEKPPEDPKEDEQKPDEPKKDAKPEPAKEQQLTREEVMRLLDILKNREEEGKKLLDQLRAARRVSVKKDW